MSLRHVGRTSGWIIVLSLGACARYQPQPLTTEGVDAALCPPDPARLTAAAGGLRHLRLPAVTLDPAVPLTPDAAAVIAVLIHPQLRTARTQRGIADAQLILADVLPNPQVNGSFDQPITGDTESAHTGWSIGLSWEVTAFITRGAKQRSAEANRQAIDLAIAWQEWQVAAAARQAVIRLAGARERLPYAWEQEHLAEENLNLHRRALSAGVMTADVMTSFEMALTDARATRIDAEAEVERERLQVVRSIGLPPQDPVPVMPLPALATPPTIPFAEMEVHVEQQRLDLIGLRAGYQSQEETVHAAVLGQFPKITLGVTRARDTSALGLLSPGVAIDLPFFDHGQGAIAGGMADRERLRAEYIQRVFEARHDLAEAEAELTAASARGREAIEAQQRAVLYERRVASANHSGWSDAISLHAARVERLHRAQEASLWHQRMCELRIAVEQAAGCLLPATNVVTASIPLTSESAP